MKEKILQLFKEANGDFVSGERLSKALNCSRTAIWKHIEELREEGYAFEAVRRSGYRLISSPDTPSQVEVQTGLQTKDLGRQIHYFHSIDSTQFKAHELAKEGVPHGTVIIADQQKGGKGRMGRPWHSPAGTGIWMSIILRPELPLYRCPQLTLITAVAVVQAIREATGVRAEIKWPNDILVKQKKICGILTELNAETDHINYLIIGIGMNVNAENFPIELRDIATSLRIQTGENVKRIPLIQRILENLEKLYQLYLEYGFSPIKSLWEAHADTIGKRVVLRQPHGSLEGLAVGINEEGILLVRKDNGEIEKVYSADIENASSPST